MKEETEKLLVDVLKDLADGQKKLAEEIKELKEAKQGDLVPVTMPDGSARLVPRENLMASTKTANAGKISVVDSKPITKEPWPDPSQPKPPGYPNR